MKPCLGTCSWEPCWQPIARNLPREFVLGTRTCSCKACLQTCPWEPCLGTCSWKPCLGTCSQGPCLVQPGYSARKPVLGTLASELEALFLEPLLVNLFLRTLLENLFLEILLGNLFLRALFLHGTLLGNGSWDLAWEPFSGTALASGS